MNQWYTGTDIASGPNFFFPSLLWAAQKVCSFQCWYSWPPAPSYFLMFCHDPINNKFWQGYQLKIWITLTFYNCLNTCKNCPKLDFDDTLQISNSIIKTKQRGRAATKKRAFRQKSKGILYWAILCLAKMTNFLVCDECFTLKRVSSVIHFNYKDIGRKWRIFGAVTKILPGEYTLPINFCPTKY